MTQMFVIPNAQVVRGPQGVPGPQGPQGPAGTGNVTGPANSVDSDLVAFDGTNGILLKDSGKKLTDLVPYSGAISDVNLGTRAFTTTGKVTSVTIRDTEYNILAMTPTLGLVAFATDLNQLMVADGSNWWIQSSYMSKDLQNPDIGYVQGSNRSGYGQSYITDKVISNSALGGNSNTQTGGLRYNATGLLGILPSIQAYFSGVWNNLVANLNLLEVGSVLEQAPPVGYTSTIQIFSGNSTILGINGVPLIQGYVASIGAYPVLAQCDGGTF